MSEKVAACPCPLKRVFARWRTGPRQVVCAALIHVTGTCKILHGASPYALWVKRCMSGASCGGDVNRANAVEPARTQARAEHRKYDDPAGSGGGKFAAREAERINSLIRTCHNTSWQGKYGGSFDSEWEQRRRGNEMLPGLRLGSFFEIHYEFSF